MTRRRSDTDLAWRELATPSPPVDRFDPDDVAGLPPPARRLLAGALAPDVALSPVVVLDMTGEIRLNRWMPFRARQVLRVGAGLVWSARAGVGPLVFRGADRLWRGGGSLDFRLWGLVPVARASGRDTDRSALGRLAAETVAWAPQGLTPAMGATWTEVDDHRATVTLPIGDDAVDVDVVVDETGRLLEVCLQRWGDPDPGQFDWYSFGGDVTERDRFDGITIATAGRVGWHWNTPQRQGGTFFRYRIDRARFPHTGP